MPLHPLKPVVRQYDLGDLRLWQDDLAEVVRLMRQLTDADIQLEADGNGLDDVADLPGLGQRIGYFTATVTHQQAELLKLEISRNRCVITATDPSLETSGAIEAIRTFLAGRRRMPAWTYPFFHNSRSLFYRKGSIPAQTPDTVLLSLLVLIGALVVGVVAVLSIASRHDHGTSTPPFGWPSSLIIAIAMAAVIAGLASCAVMSTTVMFSAARGQAPTWWMRNRAGVVIGVVIAAGFFGLGLLVH